MLVAIVFHAYFDVDIEIILDDRKQYVYDKFSIYMENMLQRLGLKKIAAWYRQNRLQREQGHLIPYVDIYKTLKRQVTQ